MTDKQIKKLNELTEMSQELGLYEDRPDWRITLQADHIKRLEEELQAKEQECEELKKELHKNFEEKDTLHLIIDRLLEASGYDTNTATAEEFEDVYEHMRYEQQQLDQLKAENDELKKQLMQKDEVDMFFNTPIEGWSNDPCGICPYKAENETYKKMLEDEDVQLALTEIRSGERHLWYNKADKLSKTLTEIKEFFNEECIICKENYINITGEICEECKYKDILQKISECEVVNE